LTFHRQNEKNGGIFMDERRAGLGRLARKGLRVLKSSLCRSGLETTVRCRVAAASLRRADAAAIALARRQPVVVGAEKLPVSFLKHADAQSILALLTVLDALHGQDWHAKSFKDWGVIAAPSLFGRHGVATSILQIQQEGAFGVSLHVIPQQSLHAMSGTISQALKIHGPNFGVSGGPNPGPDALLLAAAMLADGQLPGLWLVLTGYESEWIPAADGQPTPAPPCNALALALSPRAPGVAGLHLAIGQARHQDAGDSPLAHLPELQLGLVAEEWTNAAGLPPGRWRLGDAHWLEIETPALDAEDRP
jgi:hypothetical protein